MVTLLLEHEVDVDPLDFVAAYEGRRACKCRSCVAYRGGKTIRRLPRFFANMPLTRMSPDLQQQTLLFYAVHDGRLETMRALLWCGADVGARDKNGETALRLAALYFTSLGFLLTHGVYFPTIQIQSVPSGTKLECEIIASKVFMATYSYRQVLLIRRVQLGLWVPWAQSIKWMGRVKLVQWVLGVRQVRCEPESAHDWRDR